MAAGPIHRMRFAALIMAFFGSALALSPLQAQTFAGENAADALARNVRLLGQDSRNFTALVGAGRAALAMGDAQAAAGFFGRADEVWPASPLPQAGMGAALALEGDGAGALPFFERAVQRGATATMIGSDRGLAYDLLGQHEKAQADYRAALVGRDGDEARRRLALSLAISGNKSEALSTLGPLMARRDAASARTRAFVLALSGDVAGAKSAIDAVMPGSGSQMAYFFQKLSSLHSEQKVAATNLGIFPGSGMQIASVAPILQSPVQRGGGAANRNPPQPEDRMQAIASWLSESSAQRSSTSSQPGTEVAAASIPSAAVKSPVTSASRSKSFGSRKLWLQLASGPNAAAMPQQFARMRTRGRDLLDGISPYVVEEPGRVRLLIGPFRNSEEAGIFADDLATVQIEAFTWTSQPGQTVRKLSTE